MGVRVRAPSVAAFFVLGLTIVAPGVAETFSGSATLTGTLKLGVARCGTQRQELSAALVVAPDGTWTAGDAETSFAGTSTPVGRSGRKIRLALDEASSAALVASIEGDVATFCELSSITVTSSRPKALTLALNRTLTKAKLVVKYVFKGTADGRPGTARYVLTGRGPWTPA